MTSPHREFIKFMNSIFLYINASEKCLSCSFISPECLGCSIPVADDPNKIIIPTRRSLEKYVQSLSYFMEDSTATNGSQSPPLFGGHITWQQRDESFKVKPNMKVINKPSCLT